MKTVSPSVRCKVAINSSNSAQIGSRPDVGSSRNNNSGSSASALAKAAGSSGQQAKLTDTHRAAHAKGVVAEGTFMATPDAARLSKAVIFNGSPILVTVRFSDSTGIPNLPDGSLLWLIRTEWQSNFMYRQRIEGIGANFRPLCRYLPPYARALCARVRR
jgi:hypothetical protein